MTLSEFLLARYAEEAAIAHAAMSDADEQGRWHARHFDYEGMGVSAGEDAGPREHFIGPIPHQQPPMSLVDWADETTDHITLWSPGRVLADIAAKRRIVQLAIDNNEYPDPYETEKVWEDVLPLLALPFASHPDYEESWKP